MTFKFYMLETMAIFNTFTKKAIPNTKTGTELYRNPGKTIFRYYFVYLQD